MPTDTEERQAPPHATNVNTNDRNVTLESTTGPIPIPDGTAIASANIMHAASVLKPHHINPQYAKPNSSDVLRTPYGTWATWVLILGAKERNIQSIACNLTAAEALDLKKTARRWKQLLAQRKFKGNRVNVRAAVAAGVLEG
jgi:hypothetical protein